MSFQSSSFNQTVYRLSIYECPDAEKMLALLVVLPDGFSDKVAMRNALKACFSQSFAFDKTIKKLKQAALIYIDERIEFSCIQILPSIKGGYQDMLHIAEMLRW